MNPGHQDRETKGRLNIYSNVFKISVAQLYGSCNDVLKPPCVSLIYGSVDYYSTDRVIFILLFWEAAVFNYLIWLVRVAGYGWRIGLQVRVAG